MAAPKKFSIPLFLLAVGAQYMALMIVLRLVVPHVWATQVRAGPLAFLVVLIVAKVVNCFWEWPFHRYVLHRTVIRQLRSLTTAHRRHHALTLIKLVTGTAGPGRIVLNRYPIVETEQFESSAFPWYSLVVFWLVFTPLFVAGQMLLPKAPILLGGYSAVTISMISYEVFHAVEHFPYDWWKKAVEHPRLGWIWKNVYSFHHFHHANVSSNEAISGFFGLPLADWVLGTYHQPEDLLLDGRIATAKDFVVHPPRRIVVWLDALAKHREGTITHHQFP